MSIIRRDCKAAISGASADVQERLERSGNVPYFQSVAVATLRVQNVMRRSRAADTRRYARGPCPAEDGALPLAALRRARAHSPGPGDGGPRVGEDLEQLRSIDQGAEFHLEIRRATAEASRRGFPRHSSPTASPAMSHAPGIVRKVRNQLPAMQNAVPVTAVFAKKHLELETASDHDTKAVSTFATGRGSRAPHAYSSIDSRAVTTRASERSSCAE